MPLPSETAVAFSWKLNRAERSEAAGRGLEKEQTKRLWDFKRFESGCILARP